MKYPFSIVKKYKKKKIETIKIRVMIMVLFEPLPDALFISVEFFHLP